MLKREKQRRRRSRNKKREKKEQEDISFKYYFISKISFFKFILNMHFLF